MRATLLFVVLFASRPLFAQNDSILNNEFAHDFYPVWQRASQYLLDVAEIMPADKYGYQPSEEVFTFGEQLMHITANLTYLNANYILGQEPENLDLDVNNRSKEEIVNNLKTAIATVDRSFLALEPGEENEPLQLFGRIDADKKRVLMLMRDHMTHHRGQLVVYLRLNGIQPPRYVGW